MRLPGFADTEPNFGGPTALDQSTREPIVHYTSRILAGVIKEKPIFPRELIP